MLHPSIRLEGTILSADILDAIERGERAHQLPKDFGLDPSTKIKDGLAGLSASSLQFGGWSHLPNQTRDLRPAKS